MRSLHFPMFVLSKFSLIKFNTLFGDQISMEESKCACCFPLCVFERGWGKRSVLVAKTWQNKFSPVSLHHSTKSYIRV